MVRFCIVLYYVSAFLLFNTSLQAQSIVLNEKDAEVWSEAQIIRGQVTGGITSGTLYLNETPVPFSISTDTFAVPIRLRQQANTLYACVSEGTVCSDTLQISLGYTLRPEVYAFAEVNGRTVKLTARVLANPDSGALSFAWREDPDNPAPLNITSSLDSILSVTIPEETEPGEYYFDVDVTDATEDVFTARTFVTVDSTGVRPFDITFDHADWVDRAVVYEITPYIFEMEGGFNDILQRLPELQSLGVNTLWIQPIYATENGGQGYDVIDYFSVRPDYGTEAELRNLIQAAHGRGMRVMFDFVPNHTSIFHSYARDAVASGPSSHYYNFYQRTFDQARYSGDYNLRTMGNMTFVYYFWTELVNLNYNNPEVVRWISEAGRYWIENFDIDGYRVDAVWGVNARTPDAMRQWRHALKRIKPEVFLLAEDKATIPSVFENRFDAAYDWAPEESWVSHWNWQTDYSPSSNPTIFNNPAESATSGLLREALTNYGNGWHEDARVFRFLENNDTFRFITHHGVQRTKMAATLLFALPGIPMIYNGQEAGNNEHPYDAYQVYQPNRPIWNQSRFGLFPFYAQLISVRKSFPALYGDRFEEIDVTPDNVDDYVYAFRRWEGDQNVFAVTNMSKNPVTANLAIPVDGLDVDAGKSYYLTDLVTGEAIPTDRSTLAAQAVPIEAYTTRILLLDDQVVSIPTGIDLPNEETTAGTDLEQNYPNPFRDETTVAFNLSEGGPVRLVVYDVLGREVARLAHGSFVPGRHTVTFSANRLSAGLYLYRLEAGGKTTTRSMLLMR